MIVCVVKLYHSVTATGVFTPSSIRRDAVALWQQIPEPVQAAYTKEYFDDFVNNMIRYSTLGVRLHHELLMTDHSVSSSIFPTLSLDILSHICLWCKNISLHIYGSVSIECFL